MLELLRIENIAVIEQAEITFRPGFNCLTGETGAGKSIVIDAISAILGQRAYRDAIRTGADRASIAAVFRGVPEYPWFQENGIPWEDELLIQREIYADGRNSCRVGGQPVTVTMLRRLGNQLIQIHGQHDSAQLFDEANHLSMLDAFAGHEARLQEYREAYLDMDALRKEIRALTMDEQEKARRMENLRFQIGEIQRADLHPGEDQELEQRRTLMRSGEKLMSALNEASVALSGGEDSDGAAAMTAQAARALGTLSGVSEQVEALANLVEELSYSVQDAAEQVRDLRDSFDFSPGALEEVESRLDVIHRLRRKYGADCAEILAYGEKCRQELESIEMADDTIARLKKVLREKKLRARTLADQLTEARAAAAREFETALISELRQLDMPRVQFVCQLEPKEHLDETGGDQCRFLMSANVGEELRQMNRVASGGELARIMLALKNVFAEKDGVEALIFDEIDTGVSGVAAQRGAEKLARLAVSRQVLCVTHLPQIAAMAEDQFLVRKEERDGRTFTAILPLDRKGRREDLARISGGYEITDTMLRGAEELLCKAEKYRSGLKPSS